LYKTSQLCHQQSISLEFVSIEVFREKVGELMFQSVKALSTIENGGIAAWL
jgi:hypothetical protein